MKSPKVNVSPSGGITEDAKIGALSVIMSMSTPLPGAPLLISYDQQSTEGYTQGSRLELGGVRRTTNKAFMQDEEREHKVYPGSAAVRA